MSLLAVPEEDLKGIIKFYTKLISKHSNNSALRGLFVSKRRFYTKELDARGIPWRVGGKNGRR